MTEDGIVGWHHWLDGYESWIIKKAEWWRINTFQLWCWRRFLRVPWIARRSNQSMLKEINPECSLEGLMLKLKLQYFGHLMWRTDSLEKTLMQERLKAGGKRDDRGWDGWMASPTRWTWVWVNSGSWWWREAWCASIYGVTKSRTRLSDWTELNQWWCLSYETKSPRGENGEKEHSSGIICDAIITEGQLINSAEAPVLY